MHSHAARLLHPHPLSRGRARVMGLNVFLTLSRFRAVPCCIIFDRGWALRVPILLFKLWFNWLFIWGRVIVLLPTEHSFVFIIFDPIWKCWSSSSNCTVNWVGCNFFFVTFLWGLAATLPLLSCDELNSGKLSGSGPWSPIFRWFKFTLKPPYSITCGELWLAIWDTSFWTFWLKFGHKGSWDIS